MVNNIPNQECKFCRKMTAKQVTNSIPNQNSYYCVYCRHTYTVVSGNTTGKIMGKRKNKKKQKTTISVAASNQKIIDKSVVVNATDDNWEVEIDCVEACSKTPDTINIWFLPLAKRKVDALMKEYTNIEWLAYLLGKKGTRDVDDIHVPDQSISAAKVDDIECEEYNSLSVIGVIHSHHTMGNTFSSTDHDWINQNHDISLCIATSGIAGQYRYKTPCGAFKIIDVNVKLKVNLDFNDEQFIESIKPKLTKKTYVYNSYPNRWNGYQGNQGWPAQTDLNKQDEINNDVPETNSFLTDEEKLELEVEIQELDFTKELTLAEEMELLDGINNPDDKETN